MTLDQFADLTALLAIIAALLTMFAIFGRLRGRPFLASNMALWAAAAIAIGSTAGSLVMSDVYAPVPCVLCWWQRIFMYPLAILLPVAAARRDLTVRPYVLALTLPGMMFGTWHTIVQRIPSLLGDSCAVGESCSGIWVRGLGVLTIPNMALVGFTAVTILLLAAPDDEGTLQ